MIVPRSTFGATYGAEIGPLIMVCQQYIGLLVTMKCQLLTNWKSLVTPIVECKFPLSESGLGIGALTELSTNYSLLDLEQEVETRYFGTYPRKENSM